MTRVREPLRSWLGSDTVRDAIGGRKDLRSELRSPSKSDSKPSFACHHQHGSSRHPPAQQKTASDCNAHPLPDPADWKAGRLDRRRGRSPRRRRRRWQREMARRWLMAVPAAAVAALAASAAVPAMAACRRAERWRAAAVVLNGRPACAGPIQAPCSSLSTGPTQTNSLRRSPAVTARRALRSPLSLSLSPSSLCDIGAFCCCV